MATQYRSDIEQDLATQLMVVRGMDRDKRAIVIKFPRQSSGTQEAFIATQLYIAERAIATTEVLSLGKQEKVVCVFDFGTYSSSNAPPRSAITTTVHLLQRNYPERLDHLLILEAPFWMRALFTIIHPFLSADTKEKLIMIGDNVSTMYRSTRTLLCREKCEQSLHSLFGNHATENQERQDWVAHFSRECNAVHDARRETHVSSGFESIFTTGSVSRIIR